MLGVNIWANREDTVVALLLLLRDEEFTVLMNTCIRMYPYVKEEVRVGEPMRHREG